MSTSTDRMRPPSGPESAEVVVVVGSPINLPSLLRLDPSATVVVEPDLTSALEYCQENTVNRILVAPAAFDDARVQPRENTSS